MTASWLATDIQTQVLITPQWVTAPILATDHTQIPNWHTETLLTSLSNQIILSEIAHTYIYDRCDPSTCIYKNTTQVWEWSDIWY